MLHFVIESVGEHGVETICDARMQYAAITWREADGKEVVRRSLTLALRQQSAHGRATGSEYFEGALQALGIGWVQALGCDRVDSGELGVYGRPALGRCELVDLSPDSRIGGRQFGKSIE